MTEPGAPPASYRGLASTASLLHNVVHHGDHNVAIKIVESNESGVLARLAKLDTRTGHLNIDEFPQLHDDRLCVANEGHPVRRNNQAALAYRD